MDVEQLSAILNENTSVVVKLYLVYVYWSNAYTFGANSYILLLLFPESLQVLTWLAPFWFLSLPAFWLTAPNNATFYNLWGDWIGYWVTKVTIFTAPISF